MTLYISTTDATKAVIRYPHEEEVVVDQHAIIQPNQVLLQIEKVAFTANVLGYAVAGELLDYFSLFPTKVKGFGKVPSWGVGKVVVSKCDAVPVGKRFYGTFPLSSNLVALRVDSREPGSFLDGAPHRKKREALYSTYYECNPETDPMYLSRETEELMLIFRPLFATAWTLRFAILEQLASTTTSSRLPARVILISASSKTAYSLAMLLKASRVPVEVVGVTSSANAAFVRSIPSAYDHVVTYDGFEAALTTTLLKKSNPPRPTIVVDFAGNPKILLSASVALEEDLLEMHVVGATHTGEADMASILAGAGYDEAEASRGFTLTRPKFYFAPKVVATIVKKFGPATFAEMLSRDFKAFLGSEFARGMRITRVSSPKEVLETYARFARGGVKGEDNVVYEPQGVGGWGGKL